MTAGPTIQWSISALALLADEDPERRIVLKSGDILLFGGPCRLIKHAVLGVLLEDCPAWMAENPCRFSFTFRDSPEVCGHEEEFKYFKIKNHLVGQDSFKVPTDPNEFKGLASQAGQGISDDRPANATLDVRQCKRRKFRSVSLGSAVEE
ncbi:MAG: hypothetical protein SGARI_003838 [Bacillariaceae sp.]